MDSAENRALATEVARRRSFLLNMDAGSISAASTPWFAVRAETSSELLEYYRGDGSPAAMT